MLKKGFLGPFPLASRSYSYMEKGKRIVLDESPTISPPLPMDCFTNFPLFWEDLNGLDPLDIEILKSSLDFPSWFDTEDFKNNFQHFVG